MNRKIFPQTFFVIYIIYNIIQLSFNSIILATIYLLERKRTESIYRSKVLKKYSHIFWCITLYFVLQLFWVCEKWKDDLNSMICIERIRVCVIKSFFCKNNVKSVEVSYLFMGWHSEYTCYTPNRILINIYCEPLMK